MTFKGHNQWETGRIRHHIALHQKVLLTCYFKKHVTIVCYQHGIATCLGPIKQHVSCSILYMLRFDVV